MGEAYDGNDVGSGRSFGCNSHKGETYESGTPKPVTRYVPGSLLGNPVPFDMEHAFNVDQYDEEPAYVGLVDASGDPDQVKQIEMRGFRENLDRMNQGRSGVDQAGAEPTSAGQASTGQASEDLEGFEERQFNKDLGVRITSACLGAVLNWNVSIAQNGFDPQTGEELPQLAELHRSEEAIASVKIGDVLRARIKDEGDWVDVTFCNAEGQPLPFEPWHDYDWLEFDKLVPMAEDEWDLSCLVTGDKVLGGDFGEDVPPTMGEAGAGAGPGEAGASSEHQWRTRWLFVDIYGRPSMECLDRRQREFDAIIADIESRLTGTYEEDERILQQAIDTADRHPAYKGQIMEACGTMLVNLAIDRGTELWRLDKPEAALEVILPYAQAIEPLRGPGMPYETTTVRYCSFTGLVSALLMEETVNLPEDGLCYAEFRPSTVFALCAVANIDLEDYKQALHWCTCGLEWDPVSPFLYFRAAECCMELGLYPAADAFVSNAHQFVSSPGQMAEWFELKSRCAQGQGNRRLAAAEFVMAQTFRGEPTPDSFSNSASRPWWMSVQTGLFASNTSAAQAAELLRQNEVPFGPSAVAIKVLNQAMGVALEHDDFDLAAECAENLFKLTGEPAAKILWERLRQAGRSTKGTR